MTDGLYPNNRGDVAVQAASRLFNVDVTRSFTIGLLCLVLAGCEDTAATAPPAPTEVTEVTEVT